ncbi:hypothetical protein N7461_003451 [Penicillium sp. DV-2018c]|nr:hypothetical protein N7461_003451 [Penicillium sp. DV-2018c]
MGRLHQDDLPASSSHSLHTLDEAPPPYTDDPELDEPVHHGQLFRPIHHPIQAVKPPASIRPLRIIDSAYALPGGTIKPHDKAPPRPLLAIHGSHTETSHGSDKDKKSNTVTDFHFKLDLAETMLTGWEGGPQIVNWMTVEVNTDEDEVKAYRGGILRSRTYKAPSKGRGISLDEASDALISHDADDEPVNGHSGPQALRLWCERFCRDPARVKSFTLHRKLNGFDSNAMRNVLSSHIRELNYRGTIHIKLSLAQQSVTIYSPHWINRMRTNKYVWWIVVLLQLWIITWPIIFFMEKRYEIAHTCWNASLIPETGSALDKCYAFNRDESTLAEYWAPAVKQAAWTRRRDELLTRLDADRLQGYTTRQIIGTRNEDSAAEQERRQRVNSGQGGLLDNVVGLVRGVSEVSQDYRFSSGWGANC